MLENLGNLGDFIGGVAVVFTLIYLALQVRQNSAVVRANARAQTHQVLSEYRQFIASDPNTLRIHHVSSDEFETLSADERRQHLYLLGYMFKSGEFVYGQYVDGLISESAWSGQLQALTNALSRVHIAGFWEIRKKDYDPAFVAAVESAPWTARETPDQTAEYMIERIHKTRPTSTN